MAIVIVVVVVVVVVVSGGGGSVCVYICARAHTQADTFSKMRAEDWSTLRDSHGMVCCLTCRWFNCKPFRGGQKAPLLPWLSSCLPCPH
eukprot:1155018-Pelagomonas_calceolata.AAC.8